MGKDKQINQNVFALACDVMKERECGGEKSGETALNGIGALFHWLSPLIRDSGFARWPPTGSWTHRKSVFICMCTRVLLFHFVSLSVHFVMFSLTPTLLPPPHHPHALPLSGRGQTSLFPSSHHMQSSCEEPLVYLAALWGRPGAVASLAHYCRTMGTLTRDSKRKERSSMVGQK